MATINLPDVDLPEDHVLIKDWAENRGMMDALVEAGIIGERVMSHIVNRGYALATEHKLLVDPDCY